MNILRHVSAAFLALCLTAAPSFAVTFNLSGTLTDGSVLGGSLEIDTNLGTIDSTSLFSTGPSNFSFTNIIGYGDDFFLGGSGATDFGAVLENAAATENFNFIFSGLHTLVGYSGGLVQGNIFDLVNFVGGPGLVSARFDVAAVPIPPALPLFLAGIGGLVLVSRRRSKG